MVIVYLAFYNSLRHRASDKCSKEKRKTINGDDLLWAMSALGFEEYVEPLKMYLHKYREVRIYRSQVTHRFCGCSCCRCYQPTAH